MTRLVPEVSDIKGNSVAIVGWDEGGAGQIHSWIGDIGLHVACFVNPTDTPPDIDIESERKKRDAKSFDFPTRDSFKDVPLVSAADWPDVIRDLGIGKAIVIAATARQRYENILAAEKKGIAPTSAIHPTATILADVEIGTNVILFPRAFVGYRSELAMGAMLNTGAQLDHHNVVGICATIDPGVVTAGNVTIGDFATVHTGATVIKRTRIGKHAIVGAGAVIIDDVPPDTTVVGVPGRVIKRLT